MATAQRPAAIYTGGSSRNLNNVQRVQRSMIRFGIFVLLGALTEIVSQILMAVSEPLGAISFAVGGLVSLVVPGLISRSLYIVSEY